MKIIIIFLALLVSACTTMPSDIKYNYSNSTQSKEISMNPGNVFNDSFVSYTLRLGLYKTSLMKDDSLVMTVQVPGLENIDSLMINLDGKQTDFKAIDTLTSHEYTKGNSQMNGYSESSKRFNVSLQFIQKMMQANQVWVRVGLSKTYIEGDFLKHKDNSSMTAYNGFKKFLNQLYKVDEKYAYLADSKTLPLNLKVVQPTIVVEAEESKDKKYERIYSPVDRKYFRHEDESVDILIVPKTYSNSLPFMFENKSNEVVKIIWDESAFINHKGEAEKIIHEGVLLKDKSLSQMPTVIPPKSNIKDSVSPVSKIVILPTSRDWGYLNICGDDVSWPEIGTTEEEDCVGGVFGFFLTYEINGKKKNVLLRYKYDKRVEIIEKKEPSPVIKIEEQKTTPVLVSQPITPTYSNNSETGLQFGVGLSSWINSATKGIISTKYRSFTTSGSMSEPIDGDFSGGLALSVNLRNLPDDSIGFTSSFEYLMNSSGKDMTKNVEISGYILKTNIAKKINSVYLYGGINIPKYQASVKNSNISGFTLSYDTSNSIGGQGGIGILANNQFAIEVEYEVLQFDLNLSQKSKTNPNTEYIEQKMESFINSVKIGLKLFF